MFNLYRDKVSCDKTDSELALCRISKDIANSFLSQPNHETIYKNFIPETEYDVIINDGDAKNNTVAYKKLLSYPYDTVQFETGDYIHWTYGGFGQDDPNETIWLLLSCDKHYQFSVGGRIYQCEQELKWYDSNGNLREYPSYVEDTLNETQPDYNKVMNYPQGTVFSYIRYDDISSGIVENKRFLFGNRDKYIAYKVQGIKNFSNENLVRFTLYRDQTSEETDDLVNGIADAYAINYSIEIDSSNFEQVVGYTGKLDYVLKLNDVETNRDITWTSSNESIGTIDQSGNIELLTLGQVEFTCTMSDNSLIYDSVTIDVVETPSNILDVRFEPNTTMIYADEKYVEYTVYKYSDDVVQSDTFTFELSGADSSNYEYVYVDGNTFKIKSLNFDYSLLNIKATSAIDGAFNNIQIQLKDLF